MRHLITGGAGFIGSNLCKQLLAAGEKIICFDNLYSSTKSNINELIGDTNFEFVKGDVVDLPHFDVDQIWNLACPASPVHYQSNPVKTLETSLLGSMNVLKLARSLGVPILQASTSEVYGDPTVSPQPESYWGNVNPIGIRACYDEGKRASEALFFDYARQYDVKVKVVRIFNTYGPKMMFNDGRVVSNFIVNAIQGKPLEVYGDGTQTRSFCFVDDTVELLIKFIKADEKFQGPLNCGNPTEHTIIELAEIIDSMVGNNVGTVMKPLPSDDPLQRKPDISLARKMLDWKPTTDLENGLKKTINYFRQLS